MRRKLAPEALYSSESYDQRHRHERHNDMPTPEHIEKVDPGGKRARELMEKFAPKAPDEK